MKALIYYGNKDIKLENHWNDPYLDDEFNAIIKINFTTNINRSLEYYSGMVFNIKVTKKGKKNVLLSGGRYDGLLKNLGSKKNINAVGAAIDMSML